MFPLIISGILLGLSFPLRIGQWVLPNCGWLAWIALVPLFLTLRAATPGQAFRRTFVAALVWYGLSLYWVYTAMHTFGHLSPLVSLGVLCLMILILAAYISIAPWLTRWIAMRWGHEPIWLLPTCWTAIELCRNFGPCGGFPWSNLAESQFAYLPLIQIVDCTGVWGLIFVIVWMNRWAAHCWARIRAGEWCWQESATWWALGIWCGLVGYGTWRYVHVRDVSRSWPVYTVALLQGNIPQEEKWEQVLADTHLATYRELTEKLGDAPIDLVIWPEASYPYTVRINIAVNGTVRPSDRRIDPFSIQQQAEWGRWWPTLIGATVEERRETMPGHVVAEEWRYNSVLATDEDGRILGRYDKTHLVPFGEYVPYQRLLFFARQIAAPIGSYHAGRDPRPILINGVAVAPLVCYEDTFPEVARGLARHGAAFFANLTNDAWYGWSGAAAQHFALSVFRAVEHRRYLVRATNTGLSGIIDATGRIVMQGRLFEPAVIVGAIRLGTGRTMYTRYGDWFAWGCSVLVVCTFCWVLLKR